MLAEGEQRTLQDISAAAPDVACAAFGAILRWRIECDLRPPLWRYYGLNCFGDFLRVNSGDLRAQVFARGRDVGSNGSPRTRRDRGRKKLEFFRREPDSPPPDFFRQIGRASCRERV